MPEFDRSPGGHLYNALMESQKKYPLEPLFGRFLTPLEQFLRRTTAGGIVLVLTTIAALVIASGPAGCSRCCCC